MFKRDGGHRGLVRVLPDAAIAIIVSALDKRKKEEWELCHALLTGKELSNFSPHLPHGSFSVLVAYLFI